MRTKPRCEGDALLALHRTEAVAHRVVHRRGADRFAVADEGKRIRDRRIGPRARRDHDASAGSDAGVLEKVFDARLSDEIEDKIDGLNLDFAFLRLNERHHSLATAATRGIRLNPLRTQIHHLNLQCASLDDVTQAYLRCRSMGYPIANAIGQHPNDRELSFYVQTPSGFEMELGWNPIVVDERAWSTTTYRGISLWGHRPENLTLRARLGRARRAFASLLHPEFIIQGDQT